MTFQEQIESYLSALPSEWKDQVVQVLMLIKNEKEKPDCDTVKQCETVTSLSPFTVEGTVVSITYTDEEGVETTRSFDTKQILNNVLNELSPACLTSEEEWGTLELDEKFQLLIDSHCECCD